MLLIVTNKMDVHADVVIKRLHELQIPFFRWNTEDLLTSQSINLGCSQEKTEAYLSAEGRTVDLVNDITTVWYRRPQKPLLPSNMSQTTEVVEFAQREAKATLNNVWRLLEDKVWINFPSYNRALDSRIYQLQLARSIGFVIPKESKITNTSSQVTKMSSTRFACKAVSAGYVKDRSGLKNIYTLACTKDELRKGVFDESVPCIFQSYVPKKLELRVTVVGREIFCCAIESQNSERTRDDWRRYDVQNVPHYSFDLPISEQNKILAFMEKAGLKFGAFDFVLTQNSDYVFLEVNPNGQWYWIEQLTGLPITEALVKMFSKNVMKKS